MVDLRLLLGAIAWVPQLAAAGRPNLVAGPELVPRVWNGQQYECRCYHDDKCWPGKTVWEQLNKTVDGNLAVHIPVEAVCHNSFDGPLGTVSTYDEAACAEVQSNILDEQWSVDQDALLMWKYFTNVTCLPTDDPTSPCGLGYYGVYIIDAQTKAHVQAAVSFARDNNIRLLIRNTGHDFIGRSTGWGGLIVRTNSFQDIEWIDEYRGPGCYHGRAVKVGAGAQAKRTLAQGRNQTPPQAMLTGECPTVGIAGGLVQGGGHGPWTPLKGMTADTALSFDVVTAEGEFKTADEHQNSDLFWALKGGGPGNFAVVLSVTFKTWDDLPSAGAYLFSNFTMIQDPDVFWEGIRIYHSHANRFVQNGLYVYFEVGELMLRVVPFVGIDKTKKELDAIVQPLLDDFKAADVPYDYTSTEYSTFWDLYNDLFENETPGHALTGGWTFVQEDVEINNDAIVKALRQAVNPRENLAAQGFLVGHLFDAGHTVSKGNGATHPAYRGSTNLLITVLPVALNASLAEKADLQDLLTNTIDEALREAGPNGCAYVNEADPFQQNWQEAFWGSNYDRLLSIKKKWDPLGVFYAVATPGAEDWEVIEYGTRLCRPIK